MPPVPPTTLRPPSLTVVTSGLPATRTVTAPGIAPTGVHSAAPDRFVESAAAVASPSVAPGIAIADGSSPTVEPTDPAQTHLYSSAAFLEPLSQAIDWFAAQPLWWQSLAVSSLVLSAATFPSLISRIFRSLASHLDASQEAVAQPTPPPGLISPLAPRTTSVLTPEKKALLRKLCPQDLPRSHMQQRDIGDCYFIGWWHALKSHPLAKHLLAHMITATDTGWWVNFPGGKKPIFVSRRELRWGGRWVLAHERWSHRLGRAIPYPKPKWEWTDHVRGSRLDRLMEKAYGRHVRLHGQADARHRNRGPDAGMMTEAVMVGGWGCEVAQLFLGTQLGTTRSLGDGWIALSRNDRPRQKVETAFAAFAKKPNQFLLWGATTAQPKTRLKKIWMAAAALGHWYVPTHAYAITHVDPVKRRVTIVNPHKTRRETTLSYDTFFTYFDMVEVSELDETALQTYLGPIDYLQPANETRNDGAPSAHQPYDMHLRQGEPMELTLAGKYPLTVTNRGTTVEIKNHDAREPYTAVLVPGEAITLGRTIFKNAPHTISSSHVEITFTANGHVHVTDLGSANGTAFRRLAPLHAPAARALPRPRQPVDAVSAERLLPLRAYRLAAAHVHRSFLRMGNAMLELRDINGDLAIIREGAAPLMVLPGMGITLGAITLGAIDPTLEHHHAILIYSPGGDVFVLDQHSRHGTKIFF